MLPNTRRRLSAVLLISSLLTGALVSPYSARAQTPPECEVATSTPETNGPTDISATTGNGSLSVAVNATGAVTVYKWPSPSFYDQIKYRTTDRSEPRMGALPNEGAFIGLAFKDPSSGKPSQWNFEWLRRWSHSQRYADADSDEIVTTFRNRKAGLTVLVRDIVVAGRSSFARNITVSRTRRSDVRRVRVVGFANFNPTVSKTPQSPTEDWCTEDDNDDGASYSPQLDAILQARSGTDESTDQDSSVVVLMGFAGKSSGHSVAPDTYDAGGEGVSAYDDAADGVLSGDESVPGPSDAALSADLTLRSRTDTTRLIFATAATEEAAASVLGRMRDMSFARVRSSKMKWHSNWVEDAPLPRRAPAAVTRLAKRALVSLHQAIDENTLEIDTEDVTLQPGGLGVASISTQPPYGLDWIRDGAYVNEVLGTIGHGALVERRNRRYAILQTRAGDSMRGGPVVPAGNWHQNFYADGVAGSTIPYSIDGTGYGIWTLWRHYERTKDTGYLFSAEIYQAIQRAAQHLTDTCTGLTNDLQCLANEGDNENLTQGLRGAMLAWLGLDSAVKAARVLGFTDNRERWVTRRDELRAAIDDAFFDEECSCYTSSFELGGTLLWPVNLLDNQRKRAVAQADTNYAELRRSFNGRAQVGGQEARGLLGNLQVWSSKPEKLRAVKRGLVWIARVPTTSRTGILGRAWMHYPEEDSPVVTMQGQPFVPDQLIFYLAALKAYGRTGYTFK